MKTVGNRLAELDKLIQSVYEDKVAGRIEPDMAFDMLDKYHAEKKTLKAEYDEMVARSGSEKQDEKDVTEFISRLKRYAGATELTREMCLELIGYVTDSFCSSGCIFSLNTMGRSSPLLTSAISFAVSFVISRIADLRFCPEIA